jgi:hypothetical protein
MNDLSKLQASHLRRVAVIYIRQSTAHQLEHNRESTERQYALSERALALGWPHEQIQIIDEDLGLSGAGTTERSDFARLAAEVALGRVGIVLGLEVSRLARNNADWYRLLEPRRHDRYPDRRRRRAVSPSVVQRPAVAGAQQSQSIIHL